MKHIGIAAVTAEGAALVYRQICALADKRLGGHRHPEITLHSFLLAEHVNVGADRHDKWADLLTRSIAKLHASGADFVICPSNTPHEVYARVAPRLPVPWLHIAQAVRREAQGRGLKRLLLLGTRFTLQSRLYDDLFEGSGSSCPLAACTLRRRRHQAAQHAHVLRRQRHRRRAGRQAAAHPSACGSIDPFNYQYDSCIRFMHKR